jgi:hypothetical protein
MRAGLSLFLILLAAAPAVAAPSLCAHLPTAGRVAQPGPDRRVAAARTADRRIICPPGFTIDAAARPPSCRGPGERSAEGDPRAACRASLAMGPFAELAAQWRPTRTCPSNPLRTVVKIEGLHAGVAEVALTSRTPGVTATTLDEDSKGLDPQSRPSAQGCFAHSCRLVQLEVAADAPDTARLELAVEGGASALLQVPLKVHCPKPGDPQG